MSVHSFTFIEFNFILVLHSHGSNTKNKKRAGEMAHGNWWGFPFCFLPGIVLKHWHSLASSPRTWFCAILLFCTIFLLFNSIILKKVTQELQVQYKVFPEPSEIMWQTLTQTLIGLLTNKDILPPNLKQYQNRDINIDLHGLGCHMGHTH